MRILFIDIDTLRPDHMGCYGYCRNTTPNIDKICSEGVKFEQYYCSDAPCLPSRASLVSGIFGIRNGAVGHGGTAADRRWSGTNRGFSDRLDNDCFHNIFRKAGMHTVSVSTFAERHSSWWFNAGFNECYNVGGRGGERGDSIYNVTQEWLLHNCDRDNWFLHVHFWDPHTPYRAPDEFGNPFFDAPFDSWIDEPTFETHRHTVGPHTANELNMFSDSTSSEYPRMLGSIKNMNELKYLIDGYDTGILYTDTLVGNLLDILREHGIYDETAIIITSDHGENFGELGIYAEHGTADNVTCKIPFIIKWPGGEKGISDCELHYSLDLLPTIADLLNVEKSNNWDGVSFASTVTDGYSNGRESLVISQMAHVCQRSARFGNWLYMRTYHDGCRLFDREMLFNVKDDPHETTDVKDIYPNLCAQGAKIILDWHDEQMLKSDSQIDPMLTVLAEGGPLHARTDMKKYIQRLKDTDRADGAEKLAKKYNIY